MKEYLSLAVEWVARLHNFILSMNDAFETHFTDKELHFLVIGALGLLLILIVYPIFKALNRKNGILAITWIYVFTVLIVITFAIEIGQRVTGTGNMEFNDIVAGMAGFFALTALIIAAQLIRALFRALFGKKKQRNRRRDD